MHIYIYILIDAVSDRPESANNIVAIFYVEYTSCDFIQRVGLALQSVLVN